MRASVPFGWLPIWDRQVVECRSGQGGRLRHFDGQRARDRRGDGRRAAGCGPQCRLAGCRSGIGRWLSAGLAKAGASVILTDNEPATGEEMAGALRDAGLSAVWLAVDLGSAGG